MDASKVNLLPQDETPNGWLLGPAGSYVTFLTDELTLLGLIERGTTVLAGFPTYLAVTEPIIRAHSPQTMEAFSRLVSAARGDAKLADRYLSDGLRISHAHACVAFWSGLESTIEDTLINHVQRVSDARQRIESQCPKLGKDLDADLSNPRHARVLVRRWEAQLKIESVIARQMRQLKAFSLDFSLSSASASRLNELCEVRNVLLHRKGVVDETFIKKVPTTKLVGGSKYEIDRAGVESFYNACAEYAVGLLGRVTKSPWIYSKSGAK